MQTNIAYTVLQQKTFITLCKSSKKPTNPRAPIHPPSSTVLLLALKMLVHLWTMTIAGLEYKKDLENI